MELIDLCEKYNEESKEKIRYGKQRVDNYSTNYAIFFELPYMEQISFHTNVLDKVKKKVPLYEGEWDGKINSTLYKIEDSIKKCYGMEIKKIIEKKNKDGKSL